MWCCAQGGGASILNMALMLGCVPLLTKERYSFNFFHEVGHGRGGYDAE